MQEQKVIHRCFLKNKMKNKKIIVQNGNRIKNIDEKNNIRTYAYSKSKLTPSQK
ncbi:MAG: hypothetical protein NTY33_04755 [Candidatus Moranbacteria bacterium]|nr:hypothetical protein [Candidatus Moranbacteria bacterium]